MRVFLTLDIGTTAVKAAAFDEEMEQLGMVIREYTLDTPKPDFVELDPEVYWESAVDGIRQILACTGVRPEEVACITCTTQGETLILLDEVERVIRPAIVWLDGRGREQADRIGRYFDRATFYRHTGLPMVNGFCPIAKLVWLQEQEPFHWRQIKKVLLLEDYLIWKLTGRYVTNPALACSTGYFDILTGTYWREMLEYCGLDEAQLPDIVSCGQLVGNLTSWAADELGLTETVLVSTGAMDQVAAAIGAGNLRDGMVSESTGTCDTVAATCRRADTQRWSPVTVYCHGSEGRYLKVLISQTSGIVYKWFRDEFCRDLVGRDEAGAAFAKMDREAQEAPPGSNGLLMYPCLAGIQFPQADEGARGVFLGIGLDTGRQCFLRAVLEGVGFMLKESVGVLGATPEEIVVLGGGSKSALWNQIKADICDVRIVTMRTEECASLGAAVLGAVACGVFKDIDAAEAYIAAKCVYAPNSERVGLYQSMYERYSQIYEQVKQLYKRIVQ